MLLARVDLRVTPKSYRVMASGYPYERVAKCMSGAKVVLGDHTEPHKD